MTASTRSPPGSIRSVALASLIGTTIEWYAYIIAMALVTIVSVLIASETREREMG